MKPKKTDGEQETTPVENMPMRVAAATGVSHVLVRPSDDLLVIKPVLVIPLIGAGIGTAILATALAVFFSSGQTGGLFVAAVGAVFLAAFCGMVLASRRFTFDRAAGTWAVRRIVTREALIIGLRAVQLIQGDWYGGRDRPQFFTYQLNLALIGG